jgi:hypothetical protein
MLRLSGVANAPTTAHWKDLSVLHQYGYELPLSGDALRVSPVSRPIQKLQRRFVYFELGRADWLFNCARLVALALSRTHNVALESCAIFSNEDKLTRWPKSG